MILRSQFRLLALAGLVICPFPLAAQAARPASTPLAARDLPRGAVIEAADVTLPAVAGSADVALSPVGWTTRRRITAGEALQAPAIAPPELIRSGQPVQLVWRDGTVEVRVTGRAMGAGGVGDRVFVRVDSRRRFEGVVEGPGLVVMDTPQRSRS